MSRASSRMAVKILNLVLIQNRMVVVTVVHLFLINITAEYKSRTRKSLLNIRFFFLNSYLIKNTTQLIFKTNLKKRNISLGNISKSMKKAEMFRVTL